MLCLFARKRQ